MDKVFVFVSEDYLMRKIFSNALFEAKERESAVSPVVGVMLMLVVTIIIAATVSAFAGGLVGTTEKTPQAAFDARINVAHQTYGFDGAFTITHLGGDPIDTARTKLITSWTNRTTKEVYFRETTALPVSKTPQDYHHGYVNLSLADANVNNTNAIYQEPYLVIPGDMPADGSGDEASLWFGNFILHPGDAMTVKGSITVTTYGWYNTEENYEKNSVIKNAMMLTDRDVVNVKLIDIPTGNVIFEKDVYVTEG